MNKIECAIIGGTGYGAGELLRLCTQHPAVVVKYIVSKSSHGQPITSFHPHLEGFYKDSFIEEIPDTFFESKGNKAIFIALPHGESGKKVNELYSKIDNDTVINNTLISNTVIIDLSGDLRIQDEAIHKEYYPKSEFLPELRSQATYGLSELNNRKIATAKIITNPGCLATTAILALAPLGELFGSNYKNTVSLNLATGSSGSGKDPSPVTHHPTRHSNFAAYRPLAHQHTPEIAQALEISGFTAPLMFAAHSLPVSRGNFCTAYIELEKNITESEVKKQYREFYKDKKFIRVLDTRSELENVIGSNFCDIGITVKDNFMIVTAALDNLIKGMAGQALQNMNIRFGLAETTGLWMPSLRPV